ncbi:MAG TPA: hypothetical protein DEA08_12395 [Planctomycetes bacterium]|nr:hypothetical protein [Planctomycetota bacterium]
MSDAPQAKRRRRRLLAALALLALLCLPCLPWPYPESDLLPGAPTLAWPQAPILALPRQDLPNAPHAIYVAELGEAGREVSLLFRDEDHPWALVDHAYDLYRYLRWRRVRDLETFRWGAESLDLRGVAAGEQGYAALAPRHLDAQPRLAECERRGERVVLYLRTWNHMIATTPEPGVDYELLADLPLRQASRAELERAARERWPR